MRAVQVEREGGELKLVARAVPEPGPGQARVRVQACGICRTDELIRDGVGGVEYPRVLGHEIAGVVDALGAESSVWKVGDRVGIGWVRGYCSQCACCRSGDFVNCDTGTRIRSEDGGFADYTIVSLEGLARIPEEMSAIDAAPLMCAGVTVFDALRNCGARGGDLVAIQGIGGLGHLAVQVAAKLGFHTVAISHGPEKEQLARECGAHRYIDSSASNAADELKKLGGAKVLVATAPNAEAISKLVPGLGVEGKLVLLAVAAGMLEVPIRQLVVKRQTVQGWPTGTAKDIEDTLSFCSVTGIKPMIETYPIEKAADAYERMLSNQARFRVVLTME